MPTELRYRRGDKIGGRYQVHKALAGGMGEVYLCLDLQEMLPIALKALQARYLASPEARTRFEREAATWVALEKHPNVVRCFYMTTVDNTPFLFLEWVAGALGDGTSLRDWLNRRGPLEPRRALEFTLDVCRALEHAQRKVPGFVHCDIKPDNVLVAQGQLAKLSDFGLAKLVREAGLVLLDGAVPAAGARCQVSCAGGTPHYMAPEQWRRELVDARTDIYAIGCLLYELLTGRCPFQAETLDGLKQQHLEEAPPSLGADVRELPGEELDRLLAPCLAKQKGERYPSASELSAAITRLFEAWNWEPLPASPEVEHFMAADYSNRGNTYYALGRHAEALADFGTAIRVDPNFASAYNNRGMTHDAMGRHTEALADYDAALRLDPRDAKAHYNRGNTYANLGRHAEALADYSAALDIDPNLAQAYYNRGNTYANLGRHAEALADYDAALRVDPNDAAAYINKGVLHARRDEWDDALRAFEGAARFGDANGAQYAAQVREILGDSSP
jgi:serine/threonine protein kinase